MSHGDRTVSYHVRSISQHAQVGERLLKARSSMPLLRWRHQYTRLCLLTNICPKGNTHHRHQRILHFVLWWIKLDRIRLDSVIKSALIHRCIYSAQRNILHVRNKFYCQLAESTALERVLLLFGACCLKMTNRVNTRCARSEWIIWWNALRHNTHGTGQNLTMKGPLTVFFSFRLPC